VPLATTDRSKSGSNHCGSCAPAVNDSGPLATR